MKLGLLRSGLLAVLCTVCAIANAAFTGALANCANTIASEVIDSSGGSASDSCANSGVINLGFDVGTFTSAADALAGYVSGSWSADVTYNHQMETGIGVGPLATGRGEAIDSLSLLSPVAGVLSFTASVSRMFGSAADVSLSVGTQFSFLVGLGSDVCQLVDSGSCTVSVAFSPGDVVSYVWLGQSTAALSGSGQLGSGSVFDGGSFGLQAVTFRDNAGNPIAGASIQAMSGAQYLTTVPVPEPETWALMLAGLGSLAMVARQRRRATR